MDDFLTGLQQQTLQAAVNRIIPADDYPGGWDAGVGDFFTQLFAREPRFVPAYRRALDALEAEAQAAGAESLAALAAEQQDALLTQVEAGRVRTRWPGVDPASFFRLLVEQTQEGFYADPGNGGNRKGIAWDMIGYRMTA